MPYVDWDSISLLGIVLILALPTILWCLLLVSLIRYFWKRADK